MSTLRSLLARSLKGVFGTLFPRQTKGAAVLMYHSLGRNTAFFTVKPEDFAMQIEELSRSGKDVIPFSELVHRATQGDALENCVSISFDDGYLDTLEVALPILRRYGMHATIFVIPGLMGRVYTTSDGITLPLFSFEDWLRLRAGEVFEMLPHTMTHYELPSLSLGVAQQEIEQSHVRLETLLQQPVPKILSFPRGKYTRALCEWLERAGWTAACTVEPGLWKQGDSFFRIPRNAVDSQTTLARFRFFLSDGVEWYSSVCSRGFFKR